MMLCKSLKPCPLCGMDVEVTEIRQESNVQEVTIECKCGLSFHHRRYELTMERPDKHLPGKVEVVGTGIYTDVDFIAAWNRRAGEG